MNGSRKWIIFQVHDYPKGLFQTYWKGVVMGFPTWTSSFADPDIKTFKTYYDAYREIKRAGYRRDYHITQYCELVRP